MSDPGQLNPDLPPCMSIPMKYQLYDLYFEKKDQNRIRIRVFLGRMRFRFFLEDRIHFYTLHVQEGLSIII